MRQLAAFLCFVATAFPAFAQIATTDVDEPEDMILGFRGKSKYQIVVPDAFADDVAKSSVMRRAAELVQQAFAANKITLPVVKEAEMDAARPALFVGATKFAAANAVDTSKLIGSSYLHKVVGKNVVIAGHDEIDPLAGKRVSSKDSNLPIEGTLFSAAEFVHRYVGARFLSPDESGTTFVPQSIIHVPPALDVQSEPQFAEQDMRNGEELFFTANHCRRFTRIWSRFGHQHPSAVPIAEYGKSHPEYFVVHRHSSAAADWRDRWAALPLESRSAGADLQTHPRTL